MMAVQPLGPATFRHHAAPGRCFHCRQPIAAGVVHPHMEAAIEFPVSRLATEARYTAFCYCPHCSPPKEADLPDNLGTDLPFESSDYESMCRQALDDIGLYQPSGDHAADLARAVDDGYGRAIALALLGVLKAMQECCAQDEPDDASSQYAV